MTDVNELRARIHALDAERSRLYHERVELQQQLADATGAQRERAAEGVRALGLSDERLAEIRDHVSRMERSGHGSPWPRYVSLLLAEVDRLRDDDIYEHFVRLQDEAEAMRRARDEALAEADRLRAERDEIHEASETRSDWTLRLLNACVTAFVRAENERDEALGQVKVIWEAIAAADLFVQMPLRYAIAAYDDELVRDKLLDQHDKVVDALAASLVRATPEAEDGD